MKKVLHIITGLGDGGAEGVLYRLCLNDNQNDHIVISLMGSGKYHNLLVQAGVKVELLNQNQGRLSFIGLFRLYSFIKAIKPDVVQTWMYHSDFLGGLLAKLLSVKTIVWNIRHSTLEKGKTKRSTLLIAKLCGALSPIIPTKIICCAESAKNTHEKYGYDRNKMVVIENGYDLSAFKPNDTENLYTPPIKLGMVGRFAPEKDHVNLLNAIKILIEKKYKITLTLVGKNLDNNNSQLNNLIKDLGLEAYVNLAGTQEDIPSFMSNIDIHLLSSSSEGFPNVLAEAMACGIPCVTTDVGDAAIIVGDTGWVSKPKNAYDFSFSIMKAIDEMVETPELWRKRKENARNRIMATYSIDTMVKKYNNVWCSIK